MLLVGPVAIVRALIVTIVVVFLLVAMVVMVTMAMPVGPLFGGSRLLSLWSLNLCLRRLSLSSGGLGLGLRLGLGSDGLRVVNLGPDFMVVLFLLLPVVFIIEIQIRVVVVRRTVSVTTGLEVTCSRTPHILMHRVEAKRVRHATKSSLTHRSATTCTILVPDRAVLHAGLTNTVLPVVMLVASEVVEVVSLFLVHVTFAVLRVMVAFLAPFLRNARI